MGILWIILWIRAAAAGGGRTAQGVNNTIACAEVIQLLPAPLGMGDLDTFRTCGGSENMEFLEMGGGGRRQRELEPCRGGLIKVSV